MRYENAAFLLKQTLNQITGNAEEWKNFLDTASRLYRYPFRDQVMIYAQRPDASACAGIELWNQAMGCLVKRGSKGIALIDDTGNKPKVRYVFDVSDIRELKHGHKPRLWEMQESYEDTIIEHLESNYRSAPDTLPFPERLMKLIEEESQDAADRIFLELKEIREGSFLEELDDLNLKLRLRETLYESTAYMVLKRCGIDIDDFPDSFGFPYITDFNTPQTIGELGAAASTLAEEFLVEIRRAVRTCEKTNAISRQKPLENTSNMDYNALKRESVNTNTEPTVDTDTDTE